MDSWRAILDQTRLRQELVQAESQDPPRVVFLRATASIIDRCERMAINRGKMNVFLWVVSMLLLAVVARTQELRNCNVDAVIPFTIGSTDDVGTLATSILGCPDGSFAVQWVGEVFVEEAIRVTGGTSLNITGTRPGAIIDGGRSAQLFHVDEGSTLHLSGMTLANGNASTGDGGAIFVNRSTVSFSGITSFMYNSAGEHGGAIYATRSAVSWDGGGTQFNDNSAGGYGGAIYTTESAVSWSGDGTQFSDNSAGGYGGAIYATESAVSWSGDGTQFSDNSAGDRGGAIAAYSSMVSWNGDGTQFSSNYAGDGGGAIVARVGTTVEWDGDGTQFSSNSASYNGGAIYVYDSNLSWDGDGTEFSSNSAGDSIYSISRNGGAIHTSDSNVSWNGDGTQFSNNSAGSRGGAIYASDSNLSWNGNSTQYSNNSAGSGGGAIYTGTYSTVSWDGDDTVFNNSASSIGGAISTSEGSTVFWDGDGTLFSSNSASLSGGAIYVVDKSTVSWNGVDTMFSDNFASGDGGAMKTDDSTVFWDGDDTLFSSNYAGETGGAIHATTDSIVSWDGNDTLFVSNAAGEDGGAIYASENSIVSWGSNCILFRNNTAMNGGVIYVIEESAVSWNGVDTVFSDNFAGLNGGAINTDDSTVFWDGDDTLFSSNYAGGTGGALYSTTGSNVSWDGYGTRFGNNSAGEYGGALYATTSTVSWVGDGTQFSNNFAGLSGGVVYATDATMSWDGDGTLFSTNYAGVEGGAIAARRSTVSWDGDGTIFSQNAADERGGAIYGYENSNLSWNGDGTLFSSNRAGDGGAICTLFSIVSSDGDGTLFSSNNATKDGGAIYAVDPSKFFWSGNTTFNNNVAGANGGGLALVDVQHDYNPQPLIDAKFIENRAGYGGGALYMMDCEIPLNFTDVAFHSNSAGGGGGAVTAQFAGDVSSPVAFSSCSFSQNVAGNSGGAVEILSGHQEFDSCRFEGNSADIGGAMILGGTMTVIRECSFISNSVSSRGLAVAVVGSADISGSTFDGNELYCASGLLFREDTEEEGPNKRFEAACFDCPGWEECPGCSITRGDVKPVCEVPLEHTTAEGPGTTVETLTIAKGHWRATNQSESILACYNADACIGGETGADGYCSPGYKGPYCAVCETGYSSSLARTCTRCSSSRRRRLVAAALIGALVAVVVIVLVCRYVLSAEVEEEQIGCFHRRVLRAVPLQALKIIVVVWQILTQFVAAANVSYPGVYQDFLNAISIINFDLGSVLSAGCLWSEIDFHGRLLVSTVWPLVVVGFLSMTYWIAMRRIGTTADHAGGAIETIRRKHQKLLLLVTFLVYSSVSSMVFQTFACETLDDGIEYLRADYSIQCTDAKHKTFEAYAGVMIMVYPVGIPLLYAVQLFQHRGVLADASADKAAAQPIVGLWEPYRPERFFYEVVECGRRIMLTGVVVFIFPNDAAQVAITMLMAFFFFGVFEVLSPYRSESDMWLSRGGHVIVFFSMFYLLLLKVDVSGERDESQDAFAGLFVAGHVFMVLAVIAEVIGVCYASRNEGVGEKTATSPKTSSVGLRPRVGSDDVPVF